MRHNQLRYFITLAERQHYTQAANALGISQPTLSHAIANLEQTLDVKLFVKSGRNVVLTDCGRMFLETAKKSTEILEEGIQKIRMIENDVKGQISMGHMYLQKNDNLLKYINGYRNTYPEDIPLFNLEYNISANIIEGIHKDEYDIGFCFRGPYEEGVESIPVKVDNLVLVVPKDHELSSLTEVSIADIVDYPHVFYNKNSFLHNTVDEYFRTLKRCPNVSCTVKEVSTLLGMVRSGMGIGIVPQSCVSKDSDVVLVKLSKVHTERIIYLVYAKNKYQSPPVKRFIKYIRENHAINI